MVASSPRIAVLCADDCGLELRAAARLVQALAVGSRLCGDGAIVALGYPERHGACRPASFAALAERIVLRPFCWRTLDASTARVAMRYARLEPPTNLPASVYADDGVAQFLECDIWILTGRLWTTALLPMRPWLAIVNDDQLRHRPNNDKTASYYGLRVLQQSRQIWTPTATLAETARRFTAAAPERVRIMPPIMPHWTIDRHAPLATRPYFLWVPTSGGWAAQRQALAGLILYYEQLGGTLPCRVMGLTQPSPEDHKAIADLLARASLKNLIFANPEFPDEEDIVVRANFVWHPTAQDEGMAVILEAASSDVPLLGVATPMLRELAVELGEEHARDASAAHLAQSLKRMEEATPRQPRPARAPVYAVDAATATAFWQGVRACL